MPDTRQDTGRDLTAGRRLNALLWCMGVLVALAVAWMLRWTLWVTMPVAVSFFIAVAAWPIADGVQRHMPRGLGWLGYVAAMTVVLLTLAMFVAGVWFAARQVAEQWPQYSDQVGQVWNSISGLLNDAGASGSGAGEGSQQPGSGALGFISDYALTFLTSFGHVLSILVLIFFLVLLMLNEARIWRAKLAVATNRRDSDFWVRIVANVGDRLRWYLLVRTLIGLISAGLYGAWLWAWGIDFVATWMLLAFLLNYIPTLGSLVAGILPAAFAFLQMDPATAVVVGLGILLIEQVMGNYVDPQMQGRSLSISPLVILMSLIVWSWVWGVAGALLAVPMTVLMLLVFAEIPAMEPIALALSGHADRDALHRQIED